MDESVREAIGRVQDENVRQNKRLDELERMTKTLSEITCSVQELAINMKHMAEIQAEQGAKLDKMENAPLDGLRAAKTTAVSTVIGIVVGALAAGVIQMIAAGI